MKRFAAVCIISLLLSACSIKPPIVTDDTTPSSLTAPKILTASPTTALVSWQWSPAPNTPDIVGFKILLGTAPQTYTRTVDVPDKNARTATITGLDTTKMNYSVMFSYTDFGIISVNTPELVFGGQPTPPFQLKVVPGSQ